MTINALMDVYVNILNIKFNDALKVTKLHNMKPNLPNQNLFW